MKYKIIIGILTYRPLNVNYGNILHHCLESIHKNTDLEDVHIIVANNSEDEKTINIITDICSKYQELTLLNLKKNLGASIAWNIITKYYDNDITIILNDDTMVYPYWLEITKFILEKNPDIGCLAYDAWTGNFYSDHEIPKDVKIWLNDCIYPDGGSIAFRREVYDNIGDFDEKFFVALEDVDFGVRLIKDGYFNYFLGTSSETKGSNYYRFLTHIGGGTGYENRKSYEHWKEKYGFSFPLSVEIENNLRRNRNKNITLVIPRIIEGDVRL